MSCGYCSRIGHTMRHCNSTAALNLLADYRRTCMTPRTDEELNQYFRSFTSDMLSLIMYSYGARSVFVNRAAKEQFIRERILQARGQPALRIDLTVVEQNQPEIQPGTPEGPPPQIEPRSPVGPPPQIEPRSPVGPPPRQAVVRETMAAYKARMQVIADTLFDAVCVSAYRITRYTADNPFLFDEMIEMLSTCLIDETRNSMPESVRVMKLIIKKFHLPRAIAPIIKQFFFNSIYREHRRVSEIIMSGLRAQGILPQAFVPHKPDFEDIQLDRADADEAGDYCCGICSEEFTRETLPTLGCNHTMCAECIIGQIKARTKSFIKCPYCRKEVKQISVGDNEVRNQLTHALVTA